MKFSPEKLLFLASIVCLLSCAQEKEIASELKIYNGKLDTQNFASFVVKVLNVDSTKNCTGVLISDKHVLTAAHCFEDKNHMNPLNFFPNPSETRIIFERVDKIGQSQFHEIGVKYIVSAKHREWKHCTKFDNDKECIFEPGVTIYKNTGLDLALVELNESISKVPFRVSPIKFANLLQFKTSASQKNTVTMAGYGEYWEGSQVQTESIKQRRHAESVVLETYLSTDSTSQAEVPYELSAGKPIKNSSFQTEAVGRVCKGDSGGPLFSYYVSKSGLPEPYLLGITSRHFSKFGGLIFSCDDAKSAKFTTSLAAQCWLAQILPNDFEAPEWVKKGEAECPTVVYDPLLEMNDKLEEEALREKTSQKK
jgi:Trypsin